jgi:hypothetical protein
MNRNFNLPPGCLADDISRESCWWVRGTRPRHITTERSIREFRDYLKHRVQIEKSKPESK